MRRSNHELSSDTCSTTELSWPGLSPELASLLDGEEPRGESGLAPEPPQRRLPSGTVRRRRLLVVDPDAVYRIGLEEPLEATLWSSMGWAHAHEAIDWLQGNPQAIVDALWCEHQLRDGSAALLVQRVRALRPGLPALVLTSGPPEALAGAYPEDVQLFAKKETAEAVRVLAGIADQPREALAVLRREA